MTEVSDVADIWNDLLACQQGLMLTYINEGDAVKLLL